MDSKSSRFAAVLVISGLILALLFALAAIAGPASAGDESRSSPDGVWFHVDEAEIQAQGERLVVPDQYRALRLDSQALAPILNSARPEFGGAADQIVLTLPLPDGTFGRFQIFESPIMAPELAAKFPNIKTYAGRGLDDPAAVARFDLTPHGFHAMILSPSGTVYIDPYSRNDTTHYVSYARADYRRQVDFVQYEPLGDKAEIESLLDELKDTNATLVSGDELRTYRLAVAATGEYTIFHGGTVPDAMAEIVTVMNRVNGIYERDVAVRMELVANNDLVIYTNPATDPYTNNNGGAMLNQNQTNLDAVIGSANYDIGHVFSTGGGGIAWLGATCQPGIKARGVTGLPSPVGDPFYVDYVSHEIGHQYGGNHTFNGSAGSCSGTNRNASTAWEPGSGTTIMAYAGICGDQNIQPNSDDHFHTGSIDEIRAFTTLGAGNSCAAITSTGNSPPTVNAGTDYTIPLNTPFTLTGSASDPNGDTLTYNWEQFDLGPAGSPNAPVGDAPLFRSFPSKDVPWRTFPQISDIISNTQTIGEILPFYARGMTFRFTVRDNNVSPSAGGVNTDEVEITVTGNAGPFLVTSPDTAIFWEIGTQQSVTWDVANTDQAPVSCAAVDILLSTDGGFTYPTTLLAGTPNDGSETLVVPSQVTTSARVQVACSDNIFFDISNANFIIDTEFPGGSVHVGDLDGSTTPGSRGQWNATVTITVHDEAENPVANASVSGTWSGGTSGTGGCTTNASGQCAVSKTNLAGAVSSVNFTIDGVSAAGSLYNAAANHDPDGDSDGSTITVFQFGPPPTPTPTPVPGADIHVGDLDGSSSTAPRGKWNATVTVLVHDVDENPVANATVSGAWSAGTSGTGSCTTNASGQCAITKTNIDGGVSSVVFSVNNVTAPGTGYDPTANHDPDGDSNGSTIGVSQFGPPPPTPTPTPTPVPGAEIHVGDLDGSSAPAPRNRWNATVTITIHDVDENPVANATVSGTWSAGTSGTGSCTTNASGQCQISKNNLLSGISSVVFTVDSVTAPGNSYDPAANHDPDGDSSGTVINIPQ